MCARFLKERVANLAVGKLMASEQRSEEPKKKKLAEFRTLLQRKIIEAEADLESLRILLGFIDEILLEKGFKRAELPKTKQSDALPPSTKRESIIPLKAVTGELLANLFIVNDSMRVVIGDDKTFNVSTPPFRQFLVERVLDKMQKKDFEAASKGEITQDKVLSYELILDDDVIREIIVKNVTFERIRELKSSVRWTFEKMHEKTKRNNQRSR